MLHSYKLVSRLACLCYGLILLGSLVLCIQMTVLFHAENAEGIAGAVLQLARALLAIIGGIFAALTLVPFSLRLLSLKKRNRVLISISVVFDLLFASAGAAFVANAILNRNGDPTAYLLGTALFLIAGLAMFCNVLSIRVLSIERKAKAKQSY
ncbi:MAG: hypothetical protein IKT72_01890 [Clostridia bacterium]|nr:hypothetical protein [Clostridia bacterium]